MPAPCNYLRPEHQCPDYLHPNCLCPTPTRLVSQGRATGREDTAEAATLQQRIAAIPWFHRMELAPDVGAWDGFYSFEAERRGTTVLDHRQLFVGRRLVKPEHRLSLTRALTTDRCVFHAVV